MAQDIITAKDFVALQKEKSIVIIDASKDKLYAQKHIPNAISIPYTSLNEKDEKIDGLMLSVEKVAEIFGKKGVSNDDTIVVYDEGSQKYSTRVYWILKYLGAKDVKLLHFNNDDFRAAKIAMTATVPTVKAKTFTVKLCNKVFADAAFVESAIGNPDVVIIDARTENEYKGIMDDKNTYSKGHIQGAVNIPYESIVKGAANVFITAEEFKALSKLDLNPEKTYLVYCKTGVKGATLYAYMVNILGLKNVKNYEGAYAEWKYLDKPVVQ